MIIVVSILATPAFSQSTNPCAPCHDESYTQYLDIVEGDPGNSIPTAVTVGQTATVTVVVENSGSAPGNNVLSSVSLTLSSENGFFTVANPTVTIASIPQGGSASATWQITGTAQGSDSLIITAQASNSHRSLSLTDAYAPNPTIVVNAPPPAVAELSAFLAAREAVTADRSKKELKQGAAASAPTGDAKTKPVRRTGRRWR